MHSILTNYQYDILEKIQSSALVSYIKDVSRSANIDSSLDDDDHRYTNHRQALYNI